MTAAAAGDPIFERGPFAPLVALFAGSSERANARAAIGLALVAWVPLLVLAAVAPGAAGGPGLQVLGVLTDYAAEARYLVALPLLVVADTLVGVRLTGIARHFGESGLVPPEAQGRFDALLASTRRWCASRWAAIVIATCVWLLVGALHEAMPVELVPAWRRGPGGHALNLAGWWHLAISVPLLLFFAGGWLWRLVAWTRFLWRVAHLPLRLAVAHPDLAAGLRFVGFSVRDFAPLGMAAGVVFAGAVANRVIDGGASLASFHNVAVVVLLCVLVLFGLPLFAFTRRLLQEWRRAVQAYGALSARMGSVFERKWLSSTAPADEEVLDAGDFSAAVDLSGYSGNVYDMHLVPYDLKSFFFLAAATALPIVPVVLLTTPLDVLLKAIAQFFF
jgi:hypothetical protein